MSVNGRPFKPDPNSYQMTGIPCGHPARYKSRDVLHFTNTDKKGPREDQQIGIPGKRIETDAEVELQNLMKNQLNSSAAYAQKKLDFTSHMGGGGEHMVGSARGILTLSEFQRVTEGDRESNQMRGLGCTEHQINHLLSQQELVDVTLARLRKRKIGNVVPHPDFVQHGLQEMKQAKELKEAEIEAEGNFEHLKKMSRHRAELESALLQNKIHPLAYMYHKKAKKANETTANIPSLEPFTEKPNKQEKRKIYGPEEQTEEPAEQCGEYDDALPSVCPSTTPATPSECVVVVAAAAAATPPAPPKKIVLTAKIESISEKTIEANKISHEEVLTLFPTYEQGTTSKVLHLKNLDKQVGVQDLVSLFIRFQEGRVGDDKISFKLMDGKMKGQAFITFWDEDTASSALNLVHGYILKGKAIIIQYGKSK